MDDHPLDRTARRRKGRRPLATALVLAAAAAWFVLLGPSTLGGPTTLVQVTGQSMEPGMHTGDLAVVRTADSYEVGDVVAFRVPMEDGSRGPVVIHRVLERVDGSMTLRGDNNGWNDPWPIRDDDVVGRLWLHLPDVGTWVGVVATPVNLAALVAATIAFLVMTGGRRHAPDDDPGPTGSRPEGPAADGDLVLDLRGAAGAAALSPFDGHPGPDRPHEALTLKQWLLVVGERP